MVFPYLFLLMDNSNILNWNLRGLSSSNKHKVVVDICSRFKIGIGGFLETKMKGPKVLDFMKQKLPNWDFYTSMVTEGRLLIVWRKVFVKVTILEDSPQFVHCLVSMVGQKHKGLQRPFSGMDRVGGNPISGVELVDSVGWLEEAHMVPLKSLGSFFTWTNNQNGSTRIYSKIDHAFVNENWFDLFPFASAVFKWEVISYHCSCIVNIQSKVSLGTKLFRFYNFWADHPQFLEVVRFSWQLPIHATGLRAVFLKSLRLKHSLKKFNHNTFGDIGLSFDMAKEKYQEAQLKAQAFPTEFCYQQSAKEAAEAYIIQEKMFYSFLSQRSKVDWLQKGDLNTSFFFAYLKQRRAANGIASFVNDQGQLVDSFPEVVSHFVEHLRGYLGNQSSASGSINLACLDLGPKLSIDHQTLLLKPFSAKEIRKALFGIPSNKSPGPDGYGSGFFKAAWQIVGSEVCSAISNCFESGNFPSDLHETSLSLIPKVANPSRAIDYRPIACYTTLYKCIAKLLCSRLALVLPAIVQPNQGAFIRGRSIAHNIMIFQDLIKNYGRAVTSPRCAIKIDLSKAYDTVDWQFLEDFLKALCFPMKFIGWIMMCLRNTSYSLLMNGRVQGKFKGKKGLRQGDPMSPLLFVLIMEYLTRRLQLAALDPSFRFHPMCKSLNLVNLCFADDLIILCKGTHLAVFSLKIALDDFSFATGLTINSAKSQIVFGGVSSTVRNVISQEMNLMEGSFPLKYLGDPMRPTKWHHEDCDIILQKIRLRLNSWSSRHLSYAGRMQLIHSVLFGLRNYWMSIFILPQSVVKEIEKLCRSFLWGSASLRSQPHLASWKKVCLPKAYGGLGFRDGALWNRAILAKYIWALSEQPEILWLVLEECHIREKFGLTEIKAAGSFGRFQPSKLYNSAQNQQIVDYYSTVWCKLSLPKHRFLLWQVINEQLLTRDNLFKLHIVVPVQLCPVCGCFPESHQHLFFTCCLSTQVLHILFSWFGFSAWPSDYTSWSVWLARPRRGLLAVLLNLVVAATVYNIWRNRNISVFDDYSMTANCLVNEIKSCLAL
ncbi:uncharacterized protein LOC133805450 [Humulus lupulus]|uniref:uncharacterized protein LOC133805450 n=1 Tax=Humulus lupulus TaxID=3486 RepID=UPI002B410936|nr:uncharacterized protein LOC133805450 [Humulus lupulus]